MKILKYLLQVKFLLLLKDQIYQISIMSKKVILKMKNQDEFFVSSNVALNTDNATLLLQSTNLIASCSLNQNRHLFQNVICYVVILQKFCGVTNNLILGLT